MGKAKDTGERVQLVPARRVIPRGEGYGPAVTVGSTIGVVAKEFSVTEEELISRSISSGLSFARDELCRQLRELGFTYAEIGGELGRAHSTIIAAVKRAKARIQKP